VLGTFFLASLRTGTNLKILLLVSTIIFGFGLMLFSLISYFPLAMLFAAISGFGTMSQSTISNTIIQVEAESHMRGRAISFLVMAMFGMLPLGSLMIGAVSQIIGAPNTMFYQGLTALIIAGLFSNFLRKERLSKKEMEQMKEVEQIVIGKI